jgi:osmotically-inducible protein OsmY
MLATSAPSAPAVAEASPLASIVHRALHQSPYLAGNRVRVETGEGEVRLHGHVGSFFEKQMAQEVVRRLDGVERVENLIQVVWA